MGCATMGHMIALAAHELSGPGGLGPVNLLVPEARVTAMLGLSGPARSTLLHLLCGLERPTGGWVEVARVRLDELSRRHLAAMRRARIGLVLEHFNLIPHMTAADNVRMVGGDRADDVLELVGLAALAQVRARDLDEEERARVALARALVTSPAVVLVEVDALDPELLRHAVDATGAAIVFATDDEDRAAAADRVIRM